ncbi:hypothetical protein D3C72_1451540 [compost metagenome]
MGMGPSCQAMAIQVLPQMRTVETYSRRFISGSDEKGVTWGSAWARRPALACTILRFFVAGSSAWRAAAIRCRHGNKDEADRCSRDDRRGCSMPWSARGRGWRIPAGWSPGSGWPAGATATIRPATTSRVTTPSASICRGASRPSASTVPAATAAPARCASCRITTDPNGWCARSFASSTSTSPLSTSAALPSRCATRRGATWCCRTRPSSRIPRPRPWCRHS